MEGESIYDLRDGKCLSCGALDTFCQENSNHICKDCFNEKSLWTSRKQQQLKVDRETREAIVKAHEEMCEKYSVLLKSFNELATTNRTLQQQIAEMSLSLDSVTASNAMLVERIAELEEHLKQKLQKIQ